MKTFPKITSAAIFFIFASPCFADKVSPHYQEQTLREKCRQEVAGSYITAYDRKNHNQDYIKLLEQKRKNLETAIRTADKEVKKRKAAEANAEYDIEGQRAIKTSEQNLELLLSLLKENSELLANARQTVEASSKIETDLRRKIEKVFDIEVVKSDPKDKFPFSIDFKEKCPTFRQECVLTKAAAFDLIEITKIITNATNCQKYGAQS